MELIYGIHLEEVILLFKQIGLALVGASALWGFVFSIRDIKQNEPKEWILDDWIGMQLFYLTLLGTVIASISYVALLAITPTHAHEGISIAPTTGEIIATFPAMHTLFLVLIALVISMLFVRARNEQLFSYLITSFFGMVFVLGFIMTSLSGWRGAFDSEQIFYFMHGFHSIFTLGSVVVLDFLFLISTRSDVLKQHIFSLFPTISKVVWVGLSLDFLSVFLITDYFSVTDKFLFTQIVIAILIINGVLLSGPIARTMMRAVKENIAVEKRWRRAGSFCGALSITSWITITTLDFFETLTLSIPQLTIAFLALFSTALLGHAIFEYLEQRLYPHRHSFSTKA